MKQPDYSSLEGFLPTPIYRSVASNWIDGILFTPSASRVPTRIPIAVDNLWEWLRPSHFPSRRSCAFGSPSPELAGASGPAGGKICRVLIRSPVLIAQLKNFSDARYHPDIGKLSSLLINYQRWGSENLALGRDLLTSAQTEAILTQAPELMQAIQSTSRYWLDTYLWDDLIPATIDEKGEIAFNAPYGYLLVPWQDPASLQAP